MPSQELLAQYPSLKPAMPINDFCQEFGIGRSYAYKEAKDGKLRITKVGGRSLIAAPDAVAWFEQYRQALASNEAE